MGSCSESLVWNSTEGFLLPRWFPRNCSEHSLQYNNKKLHNYKSQVKLRMLDCKCVQQLKRNLPEHVGPNVPSGQWQTGISKNLSTIQIWSRSQSQFSVRQESSTATKHSKRCSSSLTSLRWCCFT